MTARGLSIDNLEIRFGRNMPVVSDAGLTVAPGEFHAVVGESGSGKTMLARAVLGLLPPGAAVTGGTVRFADMDLTRIDHRAMRQVRGGRIGMIFQDPLTSLNPALKVGRQMQEALRLHGDTDREAALGRCRDMLERVGIPNPRAALSRYPHEFSGGMRQRIMIASALLPGPELLIADEPTTALDALVQAEVMALLAEVTRERQTAVLFISHDLGLVADRADRVTVMDGGRVVDQGPTGSVLTRPRHPRTRALLDALPAAPPKDAPPRGEVLLEVQSLEVTFTGRRPLPWLAAPVTKAVRGVTLELRQGECLALVGASGSGKTTVGRAIAGLVPVSGGRLIHRGRDITDATLPERRALARSIQIVFQDPMSSLDPRMRLQDIVAEGLRHDPALSPAERRVRARTALGECGLGEGFARRFPHQLSGGQRQRVGIARALVLKPEILVLDEPVSALDVTVQAQILRLLADLKERHGMSYLFVSHDLSVVREMADRIAVMNEGRIVEAGSARDIFHRPQHDFTRRLLRILPELQRHGDGYRLLRRDFTDPAQEEATKCRETAAQ